MTTAAAAGDGRPGGHRARRWSPAGRVKAQELGRRLGPGPSTGERATGIEPAPSVWKTETLPLSYAREGPQRTGRQPGAPSAYTSPRHGVWRSLVAHSLWERGAVGSNPATPTDDAGGPEPAGARANTRRIGSPRLRCGPRATDR